MKQYVKVLSFVIIIIISFSSCGTPQMQDFIGKWESEKGGVIYLNEDSTCRVINLNIYDKWWKSHSELSNFVGTWKLQNNYGGNLDYYIRFFPDGIPISFDLFIKRDISCMKNQSKWYLFTWEADPHYGLSAGADPDLGITYELRKVRGE